MLLSQQVEYHALRFSNFHNPAIPIVLAGLRNILIIWQLPITRLFAIRHQDTDYILQSRKNRDDYLPHNISPVTSSLAWMTRLRVAIIARAFEIGTSGYSLTTRLTTSPMMETFRSLWHGGASDCAYILQIAWEHYRRTNRFHQLLPECQTDRP